MVADKGKGRAENVSDRAAFNLGSRTAKSFKIRPIDDDVLQAIIDVRNVGGDAVKDAAKVGLRSVTAFGNEVLHGFDNDAFLHARLLSSYIGW
jgi:hypothetical protein